MKGRQELQRRFPRHFIDFGPTAGSTSSSGSIRVGPVGLDPARRRARLRPYIVMAWFCFAFLRLASPDLPSRRARRCCHNIAIPRWSPIDAQPWPNSSSASIRRNHGRCSLGFVGDEVPLERPGCIEPSSNLSARRTTCTSAPDRRQFLYQFCLAARESARPPGDDDVALLRTLAWIDPRRSGMSSRSASRAVR